MTDKEYDDLYDELSTLEKETGCILTGSPSSRSFKTLASNCLTLPADKLRGCLYGSDNELLILLNSLLKYIEWNTSKTGLINPVAVFDPVDLDGAVTCNVLLPFSLCIPTSPLQHGHLSGNFHVLLLVKLSCTFGITIKDIYYLSDYKSEMYKLDGFGKKSVDKLLESIEKSRNT